MNKKAAAIVLQVQRRWQDTCIHTCVSVQSCRFIGQGGHKPAGVFQLYGSGYRHWNKQAPARVAAGNIPNHTATGLGGKGKTQTWNKNKCHSKTSNDAADPPLDQFRADTCSVFRTCYSLPSRASHISHRSVRCKTWRSLSEQDSQDRLSFSGLAALCDDIKRDQSELSQRTHAFTNGINSVTAEVKITVVDTCANYPLSWWQHPKCPTKTDKLQTTLLPTPPPSPMSFKKQPTCSLYCPPSPPHILQGQLVDYTFRRKAVRIRSVQVCPSQYPTYSLVSTPSPCSPKTNNCRLQCPPSVSSTGKLQTVQTPQACLPPHQPWRCVADSTDPPVPLPCTAWCRHPGPGCQHQCRSQMSQSALAPASPGGGEDKVNTSMHQVNIYNISQFTWSTPPYTRSTCITTHKVNTTMFQVNMYHTHKVPG